MSLRRLISVQALLCVLAITAAACSSSEVAAPAAPSGTASPSEPGVPAESMAPESMAAASPGDSMAPEPTASAMSGEATVSPAAPPPNPAAAALAGKAWATAALTDVATGEQFSIADLAGKPVFVETMAIWCSNCRAQQDRFTRAFARLPAGSAEYVVLTVEPSETAKDLARYKAESGFAGRYVVAGKALSKALRDEFGTNVLNPPSVPVVFISPEGEVEFSTGSESVDEIVARAAS